MPGPAPTVSFNTHSIRTYMRLSGTERAILHECERIRSAVLARDSAGPIAVSQRVRDAVGKLSKLERDLVSAVGGQGR